MDPLSPILDPNIVSGQAYFPATEYVSILPTKILPAMFKLEEKEVEECMHRDNKKIFPTWDALGKSGLGGTCITLQGTKWDKL